LNDKDSVGIIIKDSSNGPYYCNLDNFKLHLQNKEIGEWICPRCSTSYFPNLGEKVKKGNKFSTPYGRDKLPLVAMVNDGINTEASSVYHNPKMAPFFQNMLKRTGVSITNYQTSEDV
jgi:hypothetical protein